MNLLWQDLRYGARMLARNPGFTAVAVLALALGVGANTAIFSVVNAVLLRPLPYENPEELTLIYTTDSRRADEYPVAPANYLYWKQQNNVFTDMAALSNKGWSANLTGAGEPERLQGFQVSANLFPLLGVQAARGRTFLTEEDAPGKNHVVVISHGLWQRRFGGSPDIIGRTLTLNGSGHTVVGVMPADFQFYARADLWTPLAFTAKDESDRESQYLVVIARRRHGVSPEQARAGMESISRRFDENSATEVQAGLMPPQAGLVREIRPILLVLFGAVGFVLLIACANVANLLLARAANRHKELAIRAALGASRWRVIRQLLIESVVLALLGGALGLLIATWGIDFLISGLPDYLIAANARLAAVGIDEQVLGFTLAVSLLTSLLFGFAPAFQSSRLDLNESLKEGGRGHHSASRGRSRLRGILVISEVALALVLLIGAGLMMKSFWRLSQTDPGFDPTGVLTLQINLPEDKYREAAQVREFYRQVMERTATLPGVQNVAAINNLNVSTSYTIDEQPIPDTQQKPQSNLHLISPDYFRTVRIPLIKGRMFTDRDTEGTPLVAVINEALARRRFPNEDPLGKHIRIFDASREIVGVVGQVKTEGLSETPNPKTYIPHQQMTWSGMTLMVRARGNDPASLASAIRREVQAVDKDQAVYDIKMLNQTLAEMTAPQRFSTLLLGLFAGIAALLAAVGIYGVVAYSVNSRTHEIGVRMALGAQRSDVLQLIIRQGVVLILAGVAIGLIAAFLLTRVIASLLFEVSATDPAIFVFVPLLLATVALAACYIPARRATRVEPVVALRYE